MVYIKARTITTAKYDATTGNLEAQAAIEKFCKFLYLAQYSCDAGMIARYLRTGFTSFANRECWCARMVTRASIAFIYSLHC